MRRKWNFSHYPKTVLSDVFWARGELRESRTVMTLAAEKWTSRDELAHGLRGPRLLFCFVNNISNIFRFFLLFTHILWKNR